LRYKEGGKKERKSYSYVPKSKFPEKEKGSRSQRGVFSSRKKERKKKGVGVSIIYMSGRRKAAPLT